MNTSESTMPTIPITRTTWARLARAVGDFFRSEVGWRAGWWFALLIGLLLSVSGLNVVNSYVNRDFMSAIAERQAGRFIGLAFLYVGVFALSTVVTVFCRFMEERLGLLWREWLTVRLLGSYLSDRAYYRLNAEAVVDNPDQRIAEDVKTFTVTTLSFLLLLLNGTITALAFSGVLISISPSLFMVSVTYAVIGSALTVLLGGRLVGLDYEQLKKEADFRFDLVHVRENAESIAILDGEPTLLARLRRRLADLVANQRTIISVNRNLGFFTTGYNYLIQIIPVAFIAPMYIRGEVEFGVVTQATMAFSQLLGAFSLVVTQFQQISSFAAVIARLGSIGEAIERARRPAPAAGAIELVQDDGRVAFDHLTLRGPAGGPLLIYALSATTGPEGRLLIGGPNEPAKRALFRAVAGLWDDGEGRIIRPRKGRIAFLPRRPYVAPGTLRDQFFPEGDGRDRHPDGRILAALERAGLGPVVERAGGLDVELDWASKLSPGEQQLLSFARVLAAGPRFAILERPVEALGPERAGEMYRELAQAQVSSISIAGHLDLAGFLGPVLELREGGEWAFCPADDPEGGPDGRRGDEDRAGGRESRG